MPDAGNVLLVGVLNLKMYALWGVPLTRANGYINFSKCMQAWGGLHLNPIDLFFLGNLLKPMGHKMAEISPFELSESVGVDNFIMIIREALTLFLKMHL